MAGIGLSQLPSVPTLQEIQVDVAELELRGYDSSTSMDPAVNISESSANEPEEVIPCVDGTDPLKRPRHVYTASERRKYVDLFKEEKSAAKTQYSLRLFCKQHKVSRSRMAVWLK